ncbi:MAG: aspartate--tRNA ligase [Oligoflexia bacterium]|nr:aspartate--tRNA ligase [Oligoflexia bacterium]
MQKESVTDNRGQRTHTCGELNKTNEGKTVVLSGWVAKRRDHGGLIFIDLRDRYGITQLVFDPGTSGSHESKKNAESIRSEYVISVSGTVRARPEEMVNPKISTGEIEVEVKELHLLSSAITPPFVIDENTDAGEALRLKYRYLDLRRPNIQKNLILRHEVYQAVRTYLNDNKFLEIETPILFKSTPEGARDYLVPSRVNPGTFYALVQSPQIMKQLLMVAGFDRYFQIARCFRDEDLRADRQPEFSQIDIELSFIDQEGMFQIIEGLTKDVFAKVKEMDITIPFPRMTYADAMEIYGVDKPDTRFDLKILSANEIFRSSEFKAFRSVLDTGGSVRGLKVSSSQVKDFSFSRKEFDELTKYVQQFGAKGLAWMKVEMDQTKNQLDLNSPIAKFLSDEEKKNIISQWGLAHGDIVLLVADTSYDISCASLGNLRNHLAKKLNLVDESLFNFLWVTDFPLLQYDHDSKRYVACHHPFTSPAKEHEDDLKKGNNLDKINAAAYDLVLNGFEIAGGSLRIFRQDIQESMFQALGFTKDEVAKKFGFFVDALKYGTPPHGGIAFGVDRLVMLLAGTDAIREVMAFPKTQKATCLMSECPSTVAPEQLAELSLSILKKQQEGSNT